MSITDVFLDKNSLIISFKIDFIIFIDKSKDLRIGHIKGILCFIV
jgi:hypothetical protein